MNKERWDAMSNKEKYKFLSTGVLTIKTQSALDLNAKVGDDNAVKLMFRGVVNKIVVSNWHDSQEAAALESLSNIKTFNEEGHKMSLLGKGVTDKERKALTSNNLPATGHSQLSDAFLLGYRYKESKQNSCKKCYGSGKVNDADLGDIQFNEYDCPECKE